MKTMNSFHYLAQLDKRKKADALVIPFWKGKERGEAGISLPPSLTSPLKNILASGDFKGNEGEVCILYLDHEPEKRIVLLGLGDKKKMAAEALRRSYGSLVKNCLGRKLKSLNIVVPDVDESFLRGVVEGFLMANYRVDRYKHPDPEEGGRPSLINEVTWISPHKSMKAVAEKALVLSQAINLARDLTNGNADDITPQYLEACAKEIAKRNPKIKATLFDKKRIIKEKLGLLLAVNRGSSLDPAFIILEYKGNPKSKDKTVLVGKGITYDTGGLNIKVANMEVMKCDMGGAAVCLAVMQAVAQLNLKVNLKVVIPSTENCVDAKSFKPGDVYTSYSGKTVEMMNTDAEGRLILADGLAYAAKNLHPTRLIDIATLTGGIDIALGPEATGMMSSSDQLADAFQKAGDTTGERVWRMPLFEEYRERLKSDIADIKSWNGRSAAPCVAATFMKDFTQEIPWVHFDIASTAYTTEPKKYHPKYASGICVRLIVEFLEHLGDK